jgi:hypothetical protein
LSGLSNTIYTKDFEPTRQGGLKIVRCSGKMDTETMLPGVGKHPKKALFLAPAWLLLLSRLRLPQATKKLQYQNPSPAMFHRKLGPKTQTKYEKNESVPQGRFHSG